MQTADRVLGGRAGLGPAWTRGEIEKPLGTKSMGTWEALVYTEEQQARLGVDESGNPRGPMGADAMATADKDSWPELVGADGEAAAATIRSERPNLSQVLTVPEDAMVTMDVREDRVRVFVDGTGKVARPPSCG